MVFPYNQKRGPTAVQESFKNTRRKKMDDEMTVEENKQPETLPESEPSKEATEPTEADVKKECNEDQVSNSTDVKMSEIGDLGEEQSSTSRSQSVGSDENPNEQGEPDKAEKETKMVDQQIKIESEKTEEKNLTNSPDSNTNIEEAVKEKLLGKIEEGQKKTRKRHSKKRKKPDELLKCIVCGRVGLTSEFCASGRFCSQRCVGAYASKCRAENLAAAAAAGETPEPKKRRRQKKEGKKGPGKKLSLLHAHDKNGRISPDFDDPISPSLSTISSSSEESRHKKSKLSSSDDAYFFYNAVGKERPFELELYLSITGKTGVPEDVLQEENPDFELFPPAATGFKPGMKLEAVDPKHPSCICIVSVVESQGARLRLHFDGWSESYDFWTNSDSHFLFPAGWCKKNGQKLHPPRGISENEFDWPRYLSETKSEPAPDHLFRAVPETTHKFTTSMKLEAVDKKNPDLTCVASITNVIGDYFLVHFDEWDDTYDYWCKEDCPYLHPIGWCAENGIRLTPPQDDQVDSFNWQEYLKQTNTIAVPVEILKKRKETRFEIGQKLEVVDPRNPSLLRLATVIIIDNFQLKIHFDGWDDLYDFWFDSASNDLHPIRWGEKTGHLLDPPPSFLEAQDTTLCPTPGCRGIGHVKGAKYTTHHSIFGCPYSPHNVSRGSPLVDRLASNSMVEEPSISSRVYNCNILKNGDQSPDSTTKSDLIKQKLLKGIVGRPAKRGSDKVVYKTNKAISKGFPKFDIKDKPREILPKPSNSNMGLNLPNNHVTSTSADTPKFQNRSRLSLEKMTQEKKARLESSPVNNWSIREVAEFIRSIGLVEHAMSFEEQQIDGQALLLLSQADMIHHMKIKLGPALKITNAVLKY